MIEIIVDHNNDEVTVKVEGEKSVTYKIDRAPMGTVEKLLSKILDRINWQCNEGGIGPLNLTRVDEDRISSTDSW